MTTSGSIDFSVSRDVIVTEALELSGDIVEGDTPTANQLTSASRTLNMLVKAWQGKGLNLYAVQRTYLFLKENQSEYSLGTSTSDHYTTSFVKTQLASTVVAGASTITVDSVTGIANTYYIGVELDDGTVQWTTVNGAPVGVVVTLTVALTGAAAADNYVFCYATKANRPMKLLNAVARTTADRDRPIKPLNRSDYIRLAAKTSDGSPLQIYYDPQISTGKLFVYPETTDETEYMVIWVQRTLEDFDAAGDTPDFPQEWYMALVTNLAMFLATKSGAPTTTFNRIATFATMFKDEAEGFDVEDGFRIQPDKDYGR